MTTTLRTARQRAAAAQSRREPLGARKMSYVIPSVVALTLSLFMLMHAVSGADVFQLDFNGDLYNAGVKIFHRIDPYQPHALAAEAATVKAGGTIPLTVSPRYPAPMLVAAAPLSLLPRPLADVLYMIISLGVVVAGLRLLGIRDWRCIILACMSWPAVSGIWQGNVSPLLFLAAAAAWRWRANIWPGAISIAGAVTAKLFLWPLLAWLAVTKRWRMLALAGFVGAAAVVVGWAAIGFAEFTKYPSILLNVASVGEGRGCSLVAAFMALGCSSGVARGLTLVAGFLVIGVACRVLRLEDGERRAYSLFVTAGLIACPVVWAHYLVLLYVPLALCSPRFSPMWFVPMAAALDPGLSDHPSLLGSLPAITAELAVVAWLSAPLITRAHAAAPRTSAAPGPGRAVVPLRWIPSRSRAAHC